MEFSAPTIALARATPGCHDFVVASDPVEEDRVNLFERWRDAGTLRAFRGEAPATI